MERPASYLATEVFTPGRYPRYTYIEREDSRFENRLRDAIETPGQVISLSGPSKSGKTVLVERVVGELLIPITGAGIESPEDVWERIFDWMAVPSESMTTRRTEGTFGVSASASASGKIPFVAEGEVGTSGSATVGAARERTSVERRGGLEQVVEEVAESGFVILIDDFHYMPRAAQVEVAKQIKEAARRGVRIVTASVPHRSDDVVRANPELRGRVLALDMSYWEGDQLRRIAEIGFDLLGAELDRTSLDHFVTESAGSPQLIQAICLDTSFEYDLRRTAENRIALNLDTDNRRKIFERTVLRTDFRSLVDVLDRGPKKRGTERKEYRFADATSGDVYRCILKALATDPPRLSFSYDEILRRVGNLCTGDEPVGSSIIGSCQQMDKLASERFPQMGKVVDWDEERFVLDLPDPYLLFYLRWSDRLLEGE